MSAARHQTYQPAHPCFLTCTVVGQTPLFSRPDTVQKVLDALRALQEAGRIEIYGYVILEDHVHLIASAVELAKVIDEFESSSSQQIMALLETDKQQSMLRQLKRRGAELDAEGTRRLWQPRADPQIISSGEMMQQKLQFIHENPVKRGYVNDPALWRYSSARNYAGQPGLLPVTTDW